MLRHKRIVFCLKTCWNVTRFSRIVYLFYFIFLKRITLFCFYSIFSSFIFIVILRLSLYTDSFIYSPAKSHRTPSNLAFCRITLVFKIKLCIYLLNKICIFILIWSNRIWIKHWYFNVNSRCNIWLIWKVIILS